MKYYLKQKNNLVAEAEVVIIDELSSDRAYINEVIWDHSILPFGYSSFREFINSRKPPRNRAFTEQLMVSLNTCGIEAAHIDVTLGLSLNDTYWVVPEYLSHLRYEDYNLYDNQFSKTLSLVAFTGYTTPVSGLNVSPEYTTSGALRKCWGLDSDGSITLYKSGTSGFANAGMEPYSEYFSCQILKELETPYVEYELELYKGVLVSSSKCFCSNEVSYASIAQLMSSEDYNLLGRRAIELHMSLYGRDSYLDQLLFDYITLNYDRHLNNFGVYYQPETKEVVCPARVYDNGVGLLAYAMKDDMLDSSKLEMWVNSHPHANGISFDLLMREYCNKSIKKLARRLIGFRLQQHPIYKIPDWRLEVLNKFIQNRLFKILNM